MLFGQSIFQSVLTRLDEEDAEKREDPANDEASLRIRGLTSGLAFEMRRAGTESGRRLDQDYLDNLFDTEAQDPAEAAPPQPEADLAAEVLPDLGPELGPFPEPEPETPPHFLRLSEAEVAEDLAIKPSDDIRALAAKRRAFARDNHPDGVAPHLREAADARMRMANRQIDSAIRRLRRR